jgi:hypothetical protein
MAPTVLCPYCDGVASLMSVVTSVSIFEYYVCSSCTRLSERPKGTSGRAVPLMVRPAFRKPAGPKSATQA